jgi:hypothetical protein
MILCEWDASEGNPGQSCVHLYVRILSTSSTSVSIFSVWCYSSVLYLNGRGQCECYASHKVTKSGAVSNQLTDGGRGGGVLGVTVNVFMCDRGGALYSV